MALSLPQLDDQTNSLLHCVDPMKTETILQGALFGATLDEDTYGTDNMEGAELVAGASLDADDTLDLDVPTKQRTLLLAHSGLACSRKDQTSREPEQS